MESKTKISKYKRDFKKKNHNDPINLIDIYKNNNSKLFSSALETFTNLDFMLNHQHVSNFKKLKFNSVFFIQQNLFGNQFLKSEIILRL